MKIAVVGAGIMGQLSALALVQAGFELTVFDHNLDNCSMAAAGMLTPMAELEKSDAGIYPLAQDSLTQWPKLIEQLPGSPYFQQRGSLLITHPKDKAELSRFISIISSKVGYQGAQLLNQAELKNREPELDKFTEAYYFADEAQLDNQAIMLALQAKLSEEGVQWRLNTWVKETRAHEVVLESSTERFDWVIDCRGLGAKALFKDLRGVRGELIWVKAPAVKLSHILRLLHPRYGLYIVPRPEYVYIIGASEIESEDYSPVSVRSTLELLSAAFYLHSGFAEARIIKTVTQCRPTLSDHNPRINYQEGLIAVNGLYRHGFLLAPALATALKNYVQSGEKSYSQLWREFDDIH